MPRPLRRSRKQTPDPSVEALPEGQLIRLWALRALLLLGGYRDFIQTHGYRDDELAQFLQLRHGMEAGPDGETLQLAAEIGKHRDSQLLASAFGIKPDAREAEDLCLAFSPVTAFAELRQRHQVAERRAASAKCPAVLARNVAMLAGMLHLNEVECRVLEFAVLLHTNPLLEQVCSTIGGITMLRLRHALSVILKLEPTQIEAALSRQSTLLNAGLLSVDRSLNSSMAAKLDLLSYGFADLMLSDALEPLDILRDIITRCSPAHLDFSDYQHLQRELGILRPYLKRTVAARQSGVNILMYGSPGTGKSQLGRLLAADMGLELFEISSENSDGDPIDASRRLRAHRTAQAILGNRSTMLLFDELEDVFADGNNLFGEKSTAQKHKAWINRMLEGNPVPTLWLSNNVQCMDPAFVRRFDMVIELPVPPLSQRRRIVAQAAGDLLPPAAVERIATSEKLAPALISRAISVVQRIQGDLPADQIPGAVEWMVSATLQAQGHAAIKRQDANRLPDFYDPAFINTSDDLAGIAEGLKHTRSGRMCLYGPPGTGKTAFGRWLAEQLEIPLSVKRASDIMSMWVGGTEQNLARAFREAEDEGALLLIDEVDSFLQDRRTARQSWEVSGVNEMLTQMEAFSGVFIASTNLMTGLDQAALRRFDLKLKFDFLRHDQAWAMLEQQCHALGLPAPEAALHGRMSKLARLTPGDFAAVARQHRFRPFASPCALVSALEDECVLKEGGTRTTMGFV